MRKLPFLLAAVASLAACGSTTETRWVECQSSQECARCATEPAIQDTAELGDTPPAVLVFLANPLDEPVSMSIDCILFDEGGMWAGEGRRTVTLCGRSVSSAIVQAYSGDSRASSSICSAVVLD